MLQRSWTAEEWGIPSELQGLGPNDVEPDAGPAAQWLPALQAWATARRSAFDLKVATLHSYLDLYLTFGTDIFGCDYAFQYTWFRQREETKNFDLRICIYICLQSDLSHSLVSHCIALSCPKHGSTVKYSFSSLHTFFLLYLPRWLLTLEFFKVVT